MRLDQLRYLRDINQTNSISKTAGRFFVSPQALSKSMQQLETEVGANLLLRSPFGVTLTPKGEQFLTKMSRFIDEYDALHEEFLSADQNGEEADECTSIRVCISSALASILLPRALAQFHTRHPKTTVVIEEVSYDSVFPALKSGSFEMAFFSVNDEYFYKEWNEMGDKEFHYNTLLTDRLVACVAASSPLAKKETISNKDIQKYRRTMLNVVYRQKAYEVIQRYNERYGNVDAQALYSGSNIAFHHEAMLELGVVTLMPRFVYQTAFPSKQFVAKYLEYAPGVIYHTAIYPTSRPNPQLLELTNIMSSLV